MSTGHATTANTDNKEIVLYQLFMLQMKRNNSKQGNCIISAIYAADKKKQQ